VEEAEDLVVVDLRHRDLVFVLVQGSDPVHHDILVGTRIVLVLTEEIIFSIA
jgi:hypothetical protein